MIPLVIAASVPQFDPAAVKARDLVRAQYKDWDEPRNGLVVRARPDELAAIFLPGTGMATSYFTIKADEVAAGDWTTLVTSPDLVDFYGGAAT